MRYRTIRTIPKRWLSPNNLLRYREKLGAKGQKAKGAKKGKKGAKTKAENKEVEFSDDDQRSSHSEAVNEACNTLNETASIGKSLCVLPFDRV